MPQQPKITGDAQVDSWALQVTQELNDGFSSGIIANPDGISTVPLTTIEIDRMLFSIATGAPFTVGTVTASVGTSLADVAVNLSRDPSDPDGQYDLDFVLPPSILPALPDAPDDETVRYVLQIQDIGGTDTPSWQLETNYEFADGTDGTFIVTPTGGTAQTISVGNAPSGETHAVKTITFGETDTEQFAIDDLIFAGGPTTTAVSPVTGVDEGFRFGQSNRLVSARFSTDARRDTGYFGIRRVSITTPPIALRAMRSSTTSTFVASDHVVFFSNRRIYYFDEGTSNWVVETTSSGYIPALGNDPEEGDTRPLRTISDDTQRVPEIEGLIPATFFDTIYINDFVTAGMPSGGTPAVIEADLIENSLVSTVAPLNDGIIATVSYTTLPTQLTFDDMIDAFGAQAAADFTADPDVIETFSYVADSNTLDTGQEDLTKYDLVVRVTENDGQTGGIFVTEVEGVTEVAEVVADTLSFTYAIQFVAGAAASVTEVSMTLPSNTPITESLSFLPSGFFGGFTATQSPTGDNVVRLTGSQGTATITDLRVTSVPANTSPVTVTTTQIQEGFNVNLVTITIDGVSIPRPIGGTFGNRGDTYAEAAARNHNSVGFTSSVRNGNTVELIGINTGSLDEPVVEFSGIDITETWTDGT